ncbi:MAG: M56 family metallopeptidase [Planctomycetota bacterium]
MNLIRAFDTPLWIDALGFALLNSLWIVAALAALAALLSAAWPDAPARHRHSAAFVILLAMVALPTGVFGVTLGLTLTERDDFAAARVASETIIASPPVGDATSNVAVEPRSLVSPSLETTRDWTPWVVLAWSVGVVLGSLRLALGGLGVWRLKRRGVMPCDALPDARLAVLRERIGVRRVTPVLISARAASACVVGWFKPAVLLPIEVVRSLTPPQLETIVLHELAHLARRDPLLNALQCVAETLLFFHPGAWWLSARIRDERERACDEAVVAVTGDGPAYARALVVAAEATTPLPRTRIGIQWPTAALSPAATGTDDTQFRRRILGLVGMPGVTRRRGGAERLVAACLLIGLAGFAILACAPRDDGRQVVEAIPSDQREIIEVDYEALLEGDLSLDLVIRPGDLILVPVPPPGFLTLQIGDDEPVRFSYHGSVSASGMSIAQMLVLPPAIEDINALGPAAEDWVVEVRRPQRSGSSKLIYTHRMPWVVNSQAPLIFLRSGDEVRVVPPPDDFEAFPPRVDGKAEGEIFTGPIMDLPSDARRADWDPMDEAITRSVIDEDRIVKAWDENETATTATFRISRTDHDRQRGVLPAGASVGNLKTFPIPQPNFRLLNAMAAAGGAPGGVDRVYILRGGDSVITQINVEVEAEPGR